MNGIIINLTNLFSSIDKDLFHLEKLLKQINTNQDNSAIELYFNQLFNKYGLNSIIIEKYLTYLQLNNSASYNDYSIKDINDLYNEACSLFKFDIELNREKYFFNFNVIDNENEAQVQYREFEKRMNEKLKV